MFDIRRNCTVAAMAALLSLFLLVSLIFTVNGERQRGALTFRKKAFLVRKVHLASPALVEAGRNIAFESANILANAPASYLTMLDCCESDEAIADRIVTGRLTAALRREKPLEPR